MFELITFRDLQYIVGHHADLLIYVSILMLSINVFICGL